MKTWICSTRNYIGTQVFRFWKWSSQSAFASHKFNSSNYCLSRILFDKMIHKISYYFLIIGNCCLWTHPTRALHFHPQVLLSWRTFSSQQITFFLIFRLIYRFNSAPCHIDLSILQLQNDFPTYFLIYFL